MDLRITWWENNSPTPDRHKVELTQHAGSHIALHLAMSSLGGECNSGELFFTTADGTRYKGEWSIV